MVKNILCYATHSDTYFKRYEGKWFDLSCCNIVIDEDADVYGIDTDGRHGLLARFRKNVFTSDETAYTLKMFRDAAALSRSRGAAAGEIDPDGPVLSNMDLVDISGHNAKFIKRNGEISIMKINNVVASGTVGYIEKTGPLYLPCRLTSFTRKHMDTFLNNIHFITRIDEMFKKLIPDAYALQYKAAHAQPDFVIGDTAFSTVTVNWNFRTALHKDSGDFSAGFGNLTVIEHGAYHGGVTMFPRFRVGFDVRTGDFLAMNVHEYHTNSPIYTTPEDDAHNETLPKIDMSYVARNSVGGDKPYGRMALVCYLRDKIKDCDIQKTKTYYESINFTPN